MAASQASIGYGTLLEISNDNGVTWTPIGEPTSITPPSSSIDSVDVTHMQSPNRDREFIAGLNDPGECSFELNFVPGSATDTFLLAVKASFAKVKCRVTWPNGVRWAFDGIMTGYEASAPVDDKMAATATFKVTGSTVSTPAAAPVNTVLPAISGQAKVGVVLTAWAGEWSNAPVLSFVWKKAGVAIPGATSSTYTPVSGDIGSAITVTVTGTNAAGTASATSIATANVIA